MSRSSLKFYQKLAREKMDSTTISRVSTKVPGWFNRIFGLHTDFITQDKQGRVWHISFDGRCYCEETGETI